MSLALLKSLRYRGGAAFKGGTTVAENQTESRADEVARVRGYLTGQAAKLTPVQIMEKVRESQAAVLNAAAAVPAERFSAPPAEGEWSAAEVLVHVLTVVGDTS